MTKILDDYNLFKGSKKLFILVRGINKKSLKEVNEIKKKLLKKSQISSIYFNDSDIDPETIEYITSNWYYLSDFNTIPLSQKDVQKKVDMIAQELSSNAIYMSMNKKDPLSLFKKKGLNTSKNGSENLILGDEGYLLIVSIKPNIGDIKNSTILKREVETVLQGYSNTVVFCPNFYSVENSAYIKQDVRKITFMSIIIIIFVYFILMRNITMLIFSITTLALSALIAVGATQLIFKDVSILVFAFGVSIASIAEDYLFMIFLNDDYRKKRFNYEVFWGFVTTEVGLLLLSAVNFPLISQLSIFAAISLIISYLIFVFIFPKLEFYRQHKGKDIQIKGLFPPLAIAVISLGIIAITITNLKFDTNFRSLDYQNKKLLENEQFFKDVSLNSKIPILIYAEDTDILIKEANKIKKILPNSHTIADFAKNQDQIQKRENEIKNYNFEQLRTYIKQAASKADFREGVFDTSYKEVEKLQPYNLDLNALASLGIETVKHNNGYISIGYIDTNESSKINTLKSVKIVDSSELIKKSASRSFDSIRNILFAAMGLIALLIIYITKKRFLYAINFILFPLAIIILFLSFKGSFNIMHLFAIFFITIYGVDYGIYLSKQNISQSIEAVLFSCITTFAGFGILSLSNVNALKSIGEVTLLGIISITFLILQKRKKANSE